MGKTSSAKDKIVGLAYDKLKGLTKDYARKDMSVLFLGETGSGKELFADLYFENSELEGKKQKINCAALTDELLNSEIFPHVSISLLPYLI